MNILTPAEIKKYLDERVIGQDEVKKVLAVGVYNHYKRIVNDSSLDKSNVLILGPTGSGKTLLAKSLAELLDVPFAISDATTLTESGYVGNDVENILWRLIQESEMDLSKAEKGVVYIDEIDKIARKGENRSITRDVSGEGVQQALLKIVEGSVVAVPPFGGRKHPGMQMIDINTENILFILGGAFEGIEEIVKRRKKGQGSLGFGKHSTKREGVEDGVIPEDLIKFGMIPELLGRTPIVATLERPTKEMLIKILTEPKKSIISQYKELLSMDEVELEVKEDALEYIADEAMKLKSGARALRAILERAMLEPMFRIPSDKSIRKVIVDREGLESKNIKLERG